MSTRDCNISLILYHARVVSMWVAATWILVLGLVTVTCILLWNTYRRNQENSSELFSDEEYIQRIRKQLVNVYPSIDKDLILMPSYSSYTRDKKVIYLCLRDPATGHFYPESTILYVALHELAHLISKSYSVESHNQEFMDNFEMVRRRAVGMGYLPADFSVSSHSYCKIHDPVD